MLRCLKQSWQPPGSLVCQARHEAHTLRSACIVSTAHLYRRLLRLSLRADATYCAVLCSEAETPTSNGTPLANGHATQQPAASRGRPYTVSIAVPGSVIDNTQTAELATAVAGQIARTAAIFKIDEVIVIDDAANKQEGTVGAGAAFLARVLQFMETPQYLRRCDHHLRLPELHVICSLQAGQLDTVRHLC